VPQQVSSHLASSLTGPDSDFDGSKYFAKASEIIDLTAKARTPVNIRRQMINTDQTCFKFSSEKLLGSPRDYNIISNTNTEKVIVWEPEVMMHADRVEPNFDMQQSNTESFVSAQSNLDHSQSNFESVINSETSDSCYNAFDHYNLKVDGDDSGTPDEKDSS
jgi:hypothetical protein